MEIEYHSTARRWGMLCHVSVLTTYLGVPFGHLAGPLIIWLLKRDSSPYVNEQGKESLNFQISLTLYAIPCILLSFVFIGIILLAGLMLFHITMTIKAGVKAFDGEPIRYPLTIHFFR